MTGEIIAGAAAGIAQGVGVAAMESTAIVTQTAAVSVPEVVVPATEAMLEGTSAGLGIAGKAAGLTGNMSATGSQIASSASQASEAVAGVKEEIGASLVAESMAESLVGSSGTEALATKLEGLFTEGEDANSILSGLSEGLVTGEPFVSTETLLEEAQRMTEFSPEKLTDIFSHIDTLDIPSEMLEDMTFRQEVADTLLQEAQVQKAGLVEKEDVGEILGKSVESAKKNFLQRKETTEQNSVDEKELERLKKRAAMEAVMKQMEAWRQSVMQDKMLSEEAKNIALQKVNRMETRLLLQTQMQWEGKSLLKMAAVAALWLAE